MIPNFTFNSNQGSRVDLTSGKIDYQSIFTKSAVLLSLFGYNAGAAQFIQLFDTPLAAPTATIEKTDQSSWDAGELQLTVAAHGLNTGDLVKVSLTDIGTGILVARRQGSSVFTLHPTLADALADTNRDIPDTGETTGTLTLVPIHRFAIAAQDNFSVIVPRTGMNFSNGLLVAVSTSGPLYTAGAKDVTFCGTLVA